MPKSVSTEKTSDKIQIPTRHYDKPQDVVFDDALTPRQKEKALKTWEGDAEALQRAEDEGMSGGEPSKLIDVVAARKKLSEKK